jgi:hypothetical protein
LHQDTPHIAIAFACAPGEPLTTSALYGQGDSSHKPPFGTHPRDSLLTRAFFSRDGVSLATLP